MRCVISCGVQLTYFANHFREKQMLFKKSISSFLIATLLASYTSTFAFADSSTTATAPSPEVMLLQNMIALRGSNFSAADIQQTMTDEVSAYVNNAPHEGQQERMEQALVSLGVYTPAQAESFAREVQDAEMRVESTNPASAQQFSNLMNQEVAQLINLRPSGAQFSMCSDGINITPLIGIVLTGGVTGYFTVKAIQDKKHSPNSVGSDSLIATLFGVVLLMVSVEGICN
jgi:hypothetical protein